MMKTEKTQAEREEAACGMRQRSATERLSGTLKGVK